MIVGSLLLILVAVTLLVLGLAEGSSPLLIGSIAASLLAAVALVAGARQAVAARGAGHPDEPEPRDGDEDDEQPPYRHARSGPHESARLHESVGRPAVLVDQPAATGAVEVEDPPDEPAARHVGAPDVARVARMAAEVLVIDGRPRYHLASCAHLRNRASESLPVGEAIELGFTPCSLCEPDRTLLADARHV